jgi:hypothetical protein
VKLTHEERAALFHGQAPAITRKTKPCEPGEVTVLSARLSIEATAVRRVKADTWLVEYMIRDNRPRLLRRVPTTDKPRKDANGKVIQPDDAYARIDSSYTSTSHAAVTDSGEGVEDDYLDRFTKRAREREAGDTTDVIVAAEKVLDAIKERAKVQPSIRRAYWPLRRELERMIEGERNKAA